MKKHYGIYNSPIGDILIVFNDKCIIKIELFKEYWLAYLKKNEEIILDESNSIFLETRKQFMEYFHGDRKEFQLPLSYNGTEFQMDVWKALLEIPYGETRSYADIAKRIDRPKAVRAIGQANRANSLPIIIPCHRVIGKNGSMVGYAGANIDIKVKLLEIEMKSGK